MTTDEKIKLAIEALKDIEVHTKPPFAKIDPRTDNLKWLNYANDVAKKALSKLKDSK